MIRLVETYYRDLNSGSFEADRYFSGQVQRYFLMKDTTPEALNKYVRTWFPRQFRNYSSYMQYDSLRTLSPTRAVYIEHVSYYQIVNNRNKSCVACVNIEFDDEGKLISLSEPKLLNGPPDCPR